MVVEPFASASCIPAISQSLAVSARTDSGLTLSTATFALAMPGSLPHALPGRKRRDWGDCADGEGLCRKRGGRARRGRVVGLSVRAGEGLGWGLRDRFPKVIRLTTSLHVGETKSDGGFGAGSDLRSDVVKDEALTNARRDRELARLGSPSRLDRSCPGDGGEFIPVPAWNHVVLA